MASPLTADHDAQIARARERGPSERRVLLVMPPDVAPAAQPHLGLGILAARLRDAGFSPLVADYAFRPGLPEVETILSRFTPAIVGVSVFSQSLTATRGFIRRVRTACPAAGIMLGGPHVTISEQPELATLLECGADVVVQGEADDRIVEVTEQLAARRAPAQVSCPPADMSRFRWPEFELFLDGAELTTYPQQLSRGCPYQCIFCNVKRISGRKFRPRDIDDAIAELDHASRRFPRLQFVKVTDDAPNTIPERIERYLQAFVARRFGARVEIMQLRADHLTPEIARLLKLGRAPYVVVGVESGDPTVFASVNKGETLAEIRRACGTVREAGLPLVMCFVLGLPGADREKDAASIEFAREMHPVHCYWNVAQPMPGTEMFEFFARRGRILSSNVAEESSLDGACYADTEAYPAIERLRMQIVAQATTNERSRHWRYFVSRGARLKVLGRVCQAMTRPRPTITVAERRW